jgi:hypothetical protein
MNILYVCHRFPFPPKRGGKIRPFNMIRHFGAAGHRVTVCSLARSDDEAREGEGIAPHCARFEMATVSNPVQTLRMVVRLPTIGPSSMGYFYSPDLKRTIDRLLATEKFDLVFVHCSSVAQYVEHVHGIPKILDFGDMDSPSGTLEERSLVKSLEPVTRGAHVVYVPYFSGGGRIGESFIYGDGSSVRNVVIVDRSGARARQSSHAVAHELGHVLLDMPGHPDDFGKDTPHLLMDSDASDASAYGPRRLTNDECARIVRESGPRSKAPILEVLPRGPVPALKLP